jgi:hypothetical protein
LNAHAKESVEEGEEDEDDGDEDAEEDEGEEDALEFDYDEELVGAGPEGTAAPSCGHLKD